jgi:hypothetical protein
MGTLRRGLIGTKRQSDKIDSPQKLLNFARRCDITLCPLDVQCIANRMGITVKEPLEFPRGVWGILEKEINGGWSACVTHTLLQFRRYIMAHQLGHYCLHRFQETFFEDYLVLPCRESVETERQANAFADEILMPEYLFYRFFANGITDVKEMSNKFGVPVLAVLLRARGLGFSWYSRGVSELFFGY